MPDRIVSEVAHFRAQRALEEQAVWLGLHGIAWGSALHDLLGKHIGHGAERLLRLLEADSSHDRQKLMTPDPWGREARRVTRHSRRDNRKEESHE